LIQESGGRRRFKRQEAGSKKQDKFKGDSRGRKQEARGRKVQGRFKRQESSRANIKLRR